MSHLKTIGIIFLVMSIIMGIIFTGTGIYADYILNKEYKSYWTLADRSSTLEAKEQYITIFVDKLNENRQDFSEYNALFLKTKQNSFDYNLQAVMTLQSRLREIKNMNTSSFEYQTAIQQITAQEQGEAQEMLQDIYSCWYLKNYPLLWNWIAMIFGCLIFLMIIGSFALIEIGGERT